MPKKTIYYNRTNTCDNIKECGDKCEERLCSHNAYREFNKKGEWTGRWFCKKCYSNNRQKSPDSQNNIIKSLRVCRIGSLNTSSEHAKGKRFQTLACRHYGWKDLNDENDNYISSIDCFDPKNGLFYQIQGRLYDDYNRCWNSGGKLERDWYKEFSSMVFYCASKDGRTIERIYIFPIEEIRKRKGITIYKNPTGSRGGSIEPWCEKYRVTDEIELKRSNEIWQQIISTLV